MIEPIEEQIPLNGKIGIAMTFEISQYTRTAHTGQMVLQQPPWMHRRFRWLVAPLPETMVQTISRRV